jgi:thiamine-phosphate pyrophosphorylase
MSSRRLPPALIAISPGDLAGEATGERGRSAAFLRALEKTCARGLSGLMLREPSLNDRAFLELARAAREILGDERWLAIHDRAHLVSAARADALHLGFQSLAPAVARTIVAPEIAIGFSAHAGDDTETWRASDYIVFGPVLDTPSKHGLKSPVGFEGLAAAVHESRVPVWAIGGLKPEHVPHVRASGARGLAVLSGIFGARDPSRACSEYLREWKHQ